MNESINYSINKLPSVNNKSDMDGILSRLGAEAPDVAPAESAKVELPVVSTPEPVAPGTAPVETPAPATPAPVEAPAAATPAPVETPAVATPAHEAPVATESVKDRAEMIREIVEKLQAELPDKELVSDKDSVKLTRDEVEDVGILLFQEAIENEALTSGDLRLLTLFMIQDTVNERPSAVTTDKWKADKYNAFSSNLATSLNEVFGVATHNPLFGILHPDGTISRPEQNYAQWSKDLSELVRFKSPSALRTKEMMAHPNEMIDDMYLAAANDPALRERVASLLDATFVQREVTENLSSEMKVVFGSNADLAISFLGKMIAEGGVPADADSALAMRIDFLNGLKALGKELRQSILPDGLADPSVQKSRKDHENFNHLMASIFGSTDKKLIINADTKEFETADLQAGEKIVTRTRGGLLGIGGKAIVVSYDDSLMGYAPVPRTEAEYDARFKTSEAESVATAAAPPVETEQTPADAEQPRYEDGIESEEISYDTLEVGDGFGIKTKGNDIIVFTVTEKTTDDLSVKIVNSSAADKIGSTGKIQLKNNDGAPVVLKVDSTSAVAFTSVTGNTELYSISEKPRKFSKKGAITMTTAELNGNSGQNQPIEQPSSQPAEQIPEPAKADPRPVASVDDMPIASSVTSGRAPSAAERPVVATPAPEQALPVQATEVNAVVEAAVVEAATAETPSDTPSVEATLNSLRTAMDTLRNLDVNQGLTEDQLRALTELSQNQVYAEAHMIDLSQLIGSSSDEERTAIIAQLNSLQSARTAAETIIDSAGTTHVTFLREKKLFKTPAERVTAVKEFLLSQGFSEEDLAELKPDNLVTHFEKKKSARKINSEREARARAERMKNKRESAKENIRKTADRAIDALAGWALFPEKVGALGEAIGRTAANAADSLAEAGVNAINAVGGAGTKATEAIAVLPARAKAGLLERMTDLLKWQGAMAESVKTNVAQRIADIAKNLREGMAAAETIRLAEIENAEKLVTKAKEAIDEKDQNVKGMKGVSGKIRGFFAGLREM